MMSSIEKQREKASVESIVNLEQPRLAKLGVPGAVGLIIGLSIPPAADGYAKFQARAGMLCSCPSVEPQKNGCERKPPSNFTPPGRSSTPDRSAMLCTIVPPLICGERVLWSEPVLYRESDDVGLRDNEVEVAMVEEGEGGFEEESAAVEVDQDGKLLVVGLWEVKTSGDGWVVGNYDVFGGNSGVGVLRRG
ncbi:hypothetical protein G2W53_005742 [Senna tora]|uniref:Uncharacterized protein n=1 Tax=Senna tora TaxID=362788 RepID=A0A834X2X2_9FABA|nr:hypothetical protein G2W53_005742 [Senna tora]